MSRVAVVLPQTFQVAFELFSLSRNHCFCSKPRMACGGASFWKLGISLAPYADGRGRLATVIGAACVEDLDRFFGNKFRKV